MEQTVMETMYPLEYISTHYPMENQIKSSVWSWWNNDKKLRYNKLGIRLLYNVSLQKQLVSFILRVYNIVFPTYTLERDCYISILNKNFSWLKSFQIIWKIILGWIYIECKKGIFHLFSNNFWKNKFKPVSSFLHFIGKLTFIKGVAIR